MPADKEARQLGSPWKEFLTELDGMLDEPLELHCVGGFVFTYFYGLLRTTGDIDYYTAIPANLNLDEVASRKAATGGPMAQSAWTVVSEIPASISPDGLLDSVSAGQLMILKNLEMQFRASGLRLRITLNLRPPTSLESLQNAMSDFGLSGFTESRLLDPESAALPKTRLLAPNGTPVHEWRDFVGPAEIGLAIRSRLGEPLYSGMESEIQ